MRSLILASRVVATVCLASSVDATAQTERFDLLVGRQQVSLEAPSDWQHIRRDDEHVFKNRIGQVHVLDSGPMTREGFAREIRQARRLFWSNQTDESLALLSRLKLRAAFSSQAQWQAFAPSWRRINRSRSGISAAERRAVEDAFAEVLRHVAALPTRDLESLTVAALDALEPMDRRDVRTQQHVSIDGRLGLLLETWDRLSHAQRTRYVFVPNGESIFIVRTGFGDFEKTGPVFDALVASIEFR